MRRLTLRKETVSELTAADLGAVVGGRYTEKLCISGIVECVPSRDCPTRDNCATLVGC
jgi:hypothetical protein